jgi:hypothetical protein
MKQPAAPSLQDAGRGMALRMAAEAMSRLGEISRSLTQLLALQQSPRKNFLAAGTVAGGGTVGVTPGSCNVQLLGAPPGVILKASPHRRGSSVQNTGTTGNLTLGLGITQPQSGQGLVLTPGQSWDGRISGEIWSGSVCVVGSQAGVAFSYLEVSGPSNRAPINEAL